MRKGYCPIMQHQISAVRVDDKSIDMQSNNVVCIADACAWWMYTTESCAMQVLALYALDRITVADEKDCPKRPEIP